MSKRNSKSHFKPTTQTGQILHPRLLVNGYVSIKQCRHGLFMYNLNDSIIGRAMDLYGEWSEAEMDCLGQMLNSGDVVIDAGANIGTHTLFFSKKVGAGGRVYSFEPQRLTFEILCANIALNGLVNVIPMQAGLAEQLAEISAPVLDPNDTQNFGALSLQGHSTGELVKLVPLDNLELKRCNLIKVDVEGMEIHVLRGAEKTIQRCRPLLFIENHATEGSPELLQILFELGYKCWWQISSYYNPDNYFKNTYKEWALNPEANMICAPKELDIEINGFEPVLNDADTFVKALTRMGLIKS